MSINWTNLVLGMVFGYLLSEFLIPRGWATKKSDTNPWNISNIQGSMRSPPDRVVNNRSHYSPGGDVDIFNPGKIGIEP